MGDTTNQDLAPTKDEAPTASGKTCGASGATPAKKFSARSTSTAAQLQRIVEALRTGPQTTDDLRALGIFQTSARIFGLRAMGYEIYTHLFDGIAADNLYHCRMAKYTLMAEPKSGDQVHAPSGDPLDDTAAEAPQYAEGA